MQCPWSVDEPLIIIKIRTDEIRTNRIRWNPLVNKIKLFQFNFQFYNLYYISGN